MELDVLLNLRQLRVGLHSKHAHIYRSRLLYVCYCRSIGNLEALLG